MVKQTRKKTVFNKAFKSICDLFDIKPSALTQESKSDHSYIDYSHIASYMVLNGSNGLDFDSFIIDFMKRFKRIVSEERINDNKDGLNIVVKEILSARKEKGLSLPNITIMGIYEDIKKILELAHSSAKEIKNSSESPTTHFDDSVLIPTEQFLGRDEIIKELSRDLIWESIYLHGIGGIGKTEIIKAIVNNISKKPIDLDGTFVKDIYWIQFANEIDNSGDYSFKESVIRAVTPYAFIDNTNRDNLYEESVHQIFSKPGSTLIVIDNIEIFSTALKAFINRKNNTRLILGTRCEPTADIQQKFKTVDIGPISLENCRNLFNAYCPFEVNERDDVDQIIKLASRHTVTIELLAKLVRKQEQKISDFLKILVECGFKFDFNGDAEENVSSQHHLLRKESKIIEQLTKLFNTINITEKERNLLIKFSTVPNIKCNRTNAIKWFSLTNSDELDLLSKAGWIKKQEVSERKNIWFIHPIIASAVRARHSECLYDICQPFIKKLTIHMQKSFDEGKKTPEMLIQFSWSLTDIFNDRFASINDVEFLSSLERVYEEVGFLNRALYINSLALKITQDLIS